MTRAHGEGPGRGRFSILGIEGTWVVDIAFDPKNPETIWFGMDDAGGVFKSEDGGRTARYVSGDVPNMSAWTIAIDPERPERVWVGDFYGYGVYRTLDGGATWALANEGLPEGVGRMIHGLAFDPASAGWLVAYTGEGLFALDTAQTESEWQTLHAAAGVPRREADGTPARAGSESTRAGSAT